MPPILTQVARASDALPLVATSTPLYPTYVITADHQQNAKKLLRNMTMSDTVHHKQAIQSGNMVFYYMSRDNLCFLTLCEESYPKRLAFLYLEEVADVILHELIKEFGNTMWRAKVDQASRPFQFIRYDPLIQRKQRDYKDASTISKSNKNRNNNNNGDASSSSTTSNTTAPSSSNSQQLNEDLSEIHNIMKRNIDEILNRGEKLEHVSNISHELRTKSKDFKWSAKKLTWQARLQQYGPVAMILFIIVCVLYVKFFL